MLSEATSSTGAPQGHRLRLLSFNIQVANGSNRRHHYVTQSWKHVLPYPRRFDNLNRIARLVSDYDVVALQETDAGSLRSFYVNQTQYLAERAHFPYWYDQINRNMGRIAQHSQGLLSKYIPSEVTEHRLPGFIPGRSAMLVRYGHGRESLILVGMHLSLGKRARKSQFDFVRELTSEYDHIILMGDLNCEADSKELLDFLAKTGLHDPHIDTGLCTYPSWCPQKKLDHILLSPSLNVEHIHVPNHAISDHLPIAVDIRLPETVHIAA
jgi:endonuclease/exonuclease/phosphatase family metal-dependent hydrolase